MTQDGAGCKNGNIRKNKRRDEDRGVVWLEMETRRLFQGAGLMPTLMALAELKYFFASALISLSVIDR